VVSTALVGARTRAEARANLVGAALRLTDAEAARIDEIMGGAAGTIGTFTPLRPAVEEWE
jgi:hypothetical protein